MGGLLQDEDNTAFNFTDKQQEFWYWRESLQNRLNPSKPVILDSFC